jgi:hypothetical protein
VSKEKTQTNLDPKTRKVTAGDITKLIHNATKDMVKLLLMTDLSFLTIC